jgi:hypothetical protein
LKLKNLRPRAGETRAFRAEVFKNEEGRLGGTLVADQGEGYAEPWLIVTDLPPEVAQASGYGLRGGIEQGYQRVQGEGWNLPRTRIRDSQRLQRLWWGGGRGDPVGAGSRGEAEVEGQSEAPQEAVGGETPPCWPDLSAREDEPQRIWSVLARGWNVLRNALAAGLLVLGSWHPEPWPDPPRPGLPPTPAACAAQTSDGQAQPAPPTTTASARRISHEDNSS